MTERLLKPIRAALLAALAVVAVQNSARAEGGAPECIAPAKPGGGFDLTCKLLQGGLKDAGLLSDPMRITYMPGGVGVVAINKIVVQRPAEANTLIAASTGTWVRMAQGKFGDYGAKSVRWLGAIAADYAMIAVRADSPFKTLDDLVTALKADPGKVVFGGGGSVGSMDWMKVAQISDRVGIDPTKFRFVAFEGGGEVYSALLGGHVQAVSGEVSESKELLKSGKIRMLAILADERLGGEFAEIPTAKEQGVDLSWPIVRGYYMGPKVSDAEYDRWAETLKKLAASDEFKKMRDDLGLYPYLKVGKPFHDMAVAETDMFEATARKFGLVK